MLEIKHPPHPSRPALRAAFDPERLRDRFIRSALRHVMSIATRCLA
jgi:hypothetical protein